MLHYEVFNKIQQIMDSPEAQESARKWLQEKCNKTDAMRQKVSSSEYIEWLYNYVSANRSANDESALYVYEGIDSENGQLLSWFVDYAKTLARQQGVQIIFDEENPFGNEEVFVKIKDKFFSAFTMYGQGSWSCVGLLENTPDNYVELPEC